MLFQPKVAVKIADEHKTNFKKLLLLNELQ